MKRLLLMRHGKSDWSAGVSSDFDRPLTKRGVKTARLIGDWILEHDQCPGIIISSPAARARKTAKLVSEVINRPLSEIVYDERIYEADVEDLLDVISDHADQKSALLVGHNPGLDALLDYLSSEIPKRNHKGKLMTTAAIAILHYKNKEDVTKQGSAKLKKLVRPGEL